MASEDMPRDRRRCEDCVHSYLAPISGGMRCRARCFFVLSDYAEDCPDWTPRKGGE